MIDRSIAALRARRTCGVAGLLASRSRVRCRTPFRRDCLPEIYRLRIAGSYACPSDFRLPLSLFLSVTPRAHPLGRPASGFPVGASAPVGFPANCCFSGCANAQKPTGCRNATPIEMPALESPRGIATRALEHRRGRYIACLHSTFGVRFMLDIDLAITRSSGGTQRARRPSPLRLRSSLAYREIRGSVWEIRHRGSMIATARAGRLHRESNVDVSSDRYVIIRVPIRCS